MPNPQHKHLTPLTERVKHILQLEKMSDIDTLQPSTLLVIGTTSMESQMLISCTVSKLSASAIYCIAFIITIMSVSSKRNFSVVHSVVSAIPTIAVGCLSCTYKNLLDIDWLFQNSTLEDHIYSVISLQSVPSSEYVQFYAA